MRDNEPLVIIDPDIIRDLLAERDALRKRLAEIEKRLWGADVLFEGTGDGRKIQVIARTVTEPRQGTPEKIVLDIIRSLDTPARKVDIRRAMFKSRHPDIRAHHFGQDLERAIARLLQGGLIMKVGLIRYTTTIAGAHHAGR